MNARSFLLTLGLLALPPLALPQESDSGRGSDGDREPPAEREGGNEAAEAPSPQRSRDFRPSERIRADQAVDFPADI